MEVSRQRDAPRLFTRQQHSLRPIKSGLGGHQKLNGLKNTKTPFPSLRSEDTVATGSADWVAEPIVEKKKKEKKKKKKKKKGTWWMWRQWKLQRRYGKKKYGNTNEAKREEERLAKGSGQRSPYSLYKHCWSRHLQFTLAGCFFPTTLVKLSSAF